MRCTGGENCDAGTDLMLGWDDASIRGTSDGDGDRQPLSRSSSDGNRSSAAKDVGEWYVAKPVREAGIRGESGLVVVGIRGVPLERGRGRENPLTANFMLLLACARVGDGSRDHEMPPRPSKASFFTSKLATGFDAIGEGEGASVGVVFPNDDSTNDLLKPSKLSPKPDFALSLVLRGPTSHASSTRWLTSAPRTAFHCSSNLWISCSFSRWGTDDDEDGTVGRPRRIGAIASNTVWRA